MLARYLRNKGTDKAPWSDWCLDFERGYMKKRYGFARVPSPQISGVDVAQMFIQRKKFVSTWTFFSKCPLLLPLLLLLLVAYPTYPPCATVSCSRSDFAFTD